CPFLNPTSISTPPRPTTSCAGRGWRLASRIFLATSVIWGNSLRDHSLLSNHILLEYKAPPPVTGTSTGSCYPPRRPLVYRPLHLVPGRWPGRGLRDFAAEDRG